MNLFDYVFFHGGWCFDIFARVKPIFADIIINRAPCFSFGSHELLPNLAQEFQDDDES